MKHHKNTIELLGKARRGYLTETEFCELIHDLLISPGGYVIDVGSIRNVNAEVALRLVEKIKKHPLLWKLLFMIA